MASSSSLLVTFLFLSTLFLIIRTSSASNSTSLNPHLSSLKSLCQSTPHPDTCFNSLKLSISININPNILNLLLQTLQIAISESEKLSSVLAETGNTGIIEKQKGALQDCKELHQITLSSLHKSMSRISTKDSRKLSDAKAYLSAALTNKNTCLEGLDSASGSAKLSLVNNVISVYKHVSNSLSMLSNVGGKGGKGRRLLGFPAWLSVKDGRILQESGGYDPDSILTVAGDGSGNFTTISDAINYAPNNSLDRIIVFIKEGVYEENVDIPNYKTNIVFLGEGSDATVIRGNRSVGDGWTTFRSATVAVSGDGFLARDITFENVAGPAKHQAVALRVNADLVAVYRCAFVGYQDTLYVHSFRQFYRECDIYGTIDFIFGNAIVIFQGCDIVARKPLSNQYNVITAQSRDDENEITGISIQNCSIIMSEDLASDPGTTKSYLGRPWRVYSTTVYIESYIGEFIDPAGWIEWPGPGGSGLDTLYYGEYENTGPGSSTDRRVTWPGYHVMDYSDASNFTVSEFISGDQWLDSTSFPYDDGV